MASEGAVVPIWRWALVAAAAVVLIVVPFLTNNKKEPQEVVETTPAQQPAQKPPETSADALMNAVNLHLSRTVPAPMERMMTVIPDDEPKTKSGGVQ